MKETIFSLSIFLLLLFTANSWADEISLSGQACGWAVLSGESQAGIRYIPRLNILHPSTEGKNIDAELSLNAHTRIFFDSEEDLENNAEIKPYRMWLRYLTTQSEIRLGLQKINFGPAKILRSLMWFDRVDVRDPLGLTEGVYALLGRYYFLNNANVWLWGIYGNQDIKGLELVKTDEDKIEFGGRFQHPVPKGEIAVSFNRRFVDKEDWHSKMSEMISDGLENRYALEGNWDMGIGLWLEMSASKTKIDSDQDRWQRLLTIGSDYTFVSGIHLVGEHFIQSSGPNISALSIDYRFNLIDSVNAIGYYDWDSKKVYSYLGWGRTYDNWKINLLAFSSKEEEAGAFKGKGIQLMLTYNH